MPKQLKRFAERKLVNPSTEQVPQASSDVTSTVAVADTSLSDLCMCHNRYAVLDRDGNVTDYVAAIPDGARLVNRPDLLSIHLSGGPCYMTKDDQAGTYPV